MAESRPIAMVVGAAGGMGSATVARLAKDGFVVASVDVNGGGLKAAMDGIDGKSYETDVTVEKDVRATVADIETTLGPIYGLVNLVGWCETHPFVTETSDYWHKCMALNFDYLMYTVHSVLPGMIERKSGRIVNVTSDAGRVGQGGEAVYAAGKGAAIAFTKSLARELARYGINVNCTAPGPTDTPLERAQDQDVVNRVIRLIPFRRWAAPEEQAAAIAFLLSPDAGFITGQTLSVNGGLTMI